MSTIEWVFGIILAIFAIAIIIVVLLQEGHQKDLGTVTGGADTFFDKNQARSIDSFLARWTRLSRLAFLFWRS